MKTLLSPALGTLPCLLGEGPPLFPLIKTPRVDLTVCVLVLGVGSGHFITLLGEFFFGLNIYFHL